MRTYILSAFLVFGLVATTAHADVPNPKPCDGKQAADSCTTSENKAGVCTEDSGALICKESTAAPSDDGDSGCSIARSAPGGGNQSNGWLWGLGVTALGVAVSRRTRRAR